MYRRIILCLSAIVALSVLVACGGASAPVGSAPTAPPPTRGPASAPPAPTAAPTAAPTTTGAQAAAGEPAIPQGLTPEGYHTLGRADAPVTLVMYSDFL